MSAFPAGVYALAGVIIGQAGSMLATRAERSVKTWRRETLLPTLIRFLEAADALVKAATVMADPDFYTGGDPAQRHKVGDELVAAMRNLAWSQAEVDIIAGDAVQQSAKKLRAAADAAVNRALEAQAWWVYEISGEPVPDDMSPVTGMPEDVIEMINRERDRFIAAAKVSAGIPKTR